jgi:hypothetical protein
VEAFLVLDLFGSSYSYAQTMRTCLRVVSSVSSRASRGQKEQELSSGTKFEMKHSIFMAIAALILMGCEIKVEVPINRAGVVITKNGEVKDQVLRPGKQIVRTDWQVVLYDVRFEELENDVDFLFKDASSGYAKLAIQFTPIVDSLPSFYRTYESIYVDPVVNVKSRWTVRKVFENYNRNDFSKKEFEKRIIEALANNREITNYVKVHKVEVVDLTW